MDEEELLEQRRRHLRPCERRLGGEDLEESYGGVDRAAAEGVDEGEEERRERGSRRGEEELLAEAERGGFDGGAGASRAP